jgi:hypothetical protein
LRHDFIPLPSQPNRLFYTVKTIEKLFEPKQARKRDSPDFHVPGRGPGKCPEKHFEKARRRLKAMKVRLAEEKKREEVMFERSECRSIIRTGRPKNILWRTAAGLLGDCVAGSQK